MSASNTAVCKHGQPVTQSKNIAFIQTECNGQLYCLGCLKIGDINDPMKELEEIICRGIDGNYNIIGYKTAAPPVLEVDWEQYVYCSMKSFYESLTCAFSLYIVTVCCGRPDNINNRTRVKVIRNARISSRSYSSPMSIDGDEVEMMSGTIKGGLKLHKYFDLIPVPVVQTGTTDALFSVTCCDAENGKACSQKCVHGQECGRMYAVGDNGTLIISDTEGKSWVAVSNSPIMGAIASVFCCDGRVMIFPADSNERPYYSDDGGNTWVQSRLTAFSSADIYPNTLTKLSDGTILGGNYVGQVMAWYNQGASWGSQFISPLSSSPIVGIAQHTNGVYAIHEDGTLIYSTDGDNWQVCATLPTGTYRTLSSNCCALWVGTKEGNLYYNTDGDAITAWFKRSYGIVGEVRAVRWQSDDNHHGLMIAGTRVYETIDGGYTWKCVYDSGNVMLWDIHICSDCKMIAVGCAGHIVELAVNSEWRPLEKNSPKTNVLTTAKVIDCTPKPETLICCTFLAHLGNNGGIQGAYGWLNGFYGYAPSGVYTPSSNVPIAIHTPAGYVAGGSAAVKAALTQWLTSGDNPLGVSLGVTSVVVTQTGNGAMEAVITVCGETVPPSLMAMGLSIVWNNTGIPPTPVQSTNSQSIIGPSGCANQ